MLTKKAGTGTWSAIEGTDNRRYEVTYTVASEVDSAITAEDIDVAVISARSEEGAVIDAPWPRPDPAVKQDIAMIYFHVLCS